MKLYRGNAGTTCIGPDGRPAQIIRVSNDEEERSTVSDLISRLRNQENVASRNIMILTPKAQGKSKWREGERIGGLALTWKIDHDDRTVGCATIHAFKGLESSVVILTELSEPDQNRMRQLEYVGSSRAKSQLVMLRMNKSASGC